MQFAALGSTGIQVSRIALGAGPVPELMTVDGADRQLAVVARAIELGVNWFDTAATYGEGRSEQSLGAALEQLGAADRVHVATKVRLRPEELGHMGLAIRASVVESLARLRVPRVTLLQLHNSITARRGDEPTSLTPSDVLGPGGVLETFVELRREGLVEHLGLTAIGQPAAMAEVIRSGQFATIQVPYGILNPSAGQDVPARFTEANYGNVIAECARQRMGVLAIRVFAGGALTGQAPSRHTYTTKFFPLDLYERDVARAAKLAVAIGNRLSLPEAAVRFSLSHPHVSSTIVGFSTPDQVDEAVRFADAGLLPNGLLPPLPLP